MPSLDVCIATIDEGLNGIAAGLPYPRNNVRYLIIHQLDRMLDVSLYSEEKQQLEDRGDTMVVQFMERGIARSRNRALSISEADYILLCDDDVVFSPNFDVVILNAFFNFTDASIVTFQIGVPGGGLFKSYSKKSYWHNFRSLAKVSSIEIAIKRDDIIKAGLQFDEKFGLGSLFPTGEEFIFLTEAFKKRLKIRYEASVILEHPRVSSGKSYDKASVKARGALFAKIFNRYYWAVNLIFALKKLPEYRRKLSFFTFIKLMFQGSKEYKRSA